MEKNYLYHKVPENIQGNVLHPLKQLEKIHPEVYLSHMENYNNRPDVPKRFIEHLNAHWEDVLMFSSVSPEQIKNALLSDCIKYNPGEMKFYQIDLEKYPELLNPQKTVLALFEYDEDGNEKKIHYQGITDELVKEHNQISDKVIQGYVDRIKQTGKPLLFLGVPHIMHAGSLDISNCPIIIV